MINANKARARSRSKAKSKSKSKKFLTKTFTKTNKGDDVVSVIPTKTSLNDDDSIVIVE
jgi:hypothetical protein